MGGARRVTTDHREDLLAGIVRDQHASASALDLALVGRIGEINVQFEVRGSSLQSSHRIRAGDSRKLSEVRRCTTS